MRTFRYRAGKAAMLAVLLLAGAETVAAAALGDEGQPAAAPENTEARSAGQVTILAASAEPAKQALAPAALQTPEDRRLSPLSGYTRRHWLEITERMLAGILPYFDPKTGLPELPGVPGDRGHDALYAQDRVMAKLQATERIMMLAVYYTAATGQDRVPGYPGSIAQPFRTAITRMSDPSDPLFRQRSGASVYLGSETALAILLSPRFFWEPLTPDQQSKVLDFLEALTRTPSYDNNHHFFHMLPVPILERHGRPSNRAQYTAALERMLSWHRGDGWFADGSNGGFDHYNFWGFQLYCNAVCHLDQPWQAQFGESFRAITTQFLRGAPYFFGRDGGPIPWGRSLAYRFAGNGALGWAHLNHADPLAPGLTRRIASGCLKYFWDHGALHANGVLESGFRGANAVVAENYLTDGTAYFAAQGMSCLLIPPQDPFWTDVEQPMPADQGGGRLVLPGAQMVVRVSPVDGEARLYPVGQPFGHQGHWQRGIKYCQHAYSSSLGWCALGEGGEDLGAGRTGFSLDGQSWTYRDRPVATRVTADHVASFEPLDAGKEAATAAQRRDKNSSGRMTTHTLIGDCGEVHVFWHNGAQPLWLHLGGYGINILDERSLEDHTTARRVHVSGEGKHSLMELLDGPAGRFAVRVLAPRDGWLHSHLFGGRGVFPYWRSDRPVGPRVPVVFYVDGCRDRVPEVPPIRIHRSPNSLRIEFEGKTHDIPTSD